MRKNNRYFFAIFAVVLAFAAIGCKPMADNNFLPQADRLKIGVCVNNYGDLYATYVRDAISAAAKGANVEIYLNNAANDQDTQYEQIDAMIERGVDAIVMAIVSIEPEASTTVIDKISAADIPVVFYNIPPALDIIKTYPKARFIGTVPEEAGIIQGEIMTDIWNKSNWDRNGDNKMQYVMFTGVSDNLEAIARTKYSIDTVVSSGIEVDKLHEIAADWNPDKAQAAMTEWLAADADNIEFVVANNDSMAAGAILALNEIGYNKGDGGKYIPVVGVDATQEAIDLIKKGRMSATVKQDAVGMGNAALKLAINAASGDDFLTGTTYKYDSTGISVRIPYQPFTGE